MSSYNCPGSGQPHAGLLDTPHLPWVARSIRHYKRPTSWSFASGPPTDAQVEAAVAKLLDYCNDRYVACASCGKAVQVRKDGAARAHPPSRIGPEKEVARRKRTALAVEKALALPSPKQQAAIELRDMLDSLQ